MRFKPLRLEYKAQAQSHRCTSPGCLETPAPGRLWVGAPSCGCARGAAASPSATSCSRPRPRPPAPGSEPGARAAAVPQPTATTVARPAGRAMLPVLLMLSGLGRLTSAGLHPETSLLQITVPRKIETDTHGEVAETHVTYAIKIDQKTYTLHLEKQSLLDPHFLVYAYNKSGTLYPDSSFIK
ncbi:A disintegrin and metallopeptidase domain 3-like, partial [Crocuta crocuta]